jgi:hypothetical protein
MYALGNIEVRSCNHCCCGKGISVTQSECVFVALVMQHVMRMFHIAMSPVLLYSIFPHFLIKGTVFEKKTLLNVNVCFDFLYKFCLKHFSF